MATLSDEEFYSKWEALFPSDGARSITGARMVLFLRDLVDSFRNKLIEDDISNYDDWDSLTTYGIDDKVTENDKIYRSLVDANLNNQPSISPLHWEEVSASVFDPYSSARGIYGTVSTIAELQAITTSDKIAGVYLMFTDSSASDLLRFYKLTVTTAAESQPDIVRPTDYNASTNPRQWVQVKPSPDLLDEDDMASNSDTQAPTQQSVKAYVDTQASQSVYDTDIRYYEQSDWIVGIGLTSQIMGWTQSGVTASQGNYGVNSTERAIGVWPLSTGTSSTGAAFLYKGLTTTPGIGIGWAALKYRNRLAIETLSDGTETFAVLSGFASHVTGVSGTTDGVFFRYTHSVNTGKWEAVCISASTETAVDTGITADTSYHVFDIRINEAGTEATFYINGSLVATITTNIPTALLNLRFGINKSAGTTARFLYSDWYDLLITRTTSR